MINPVEIGTGRVGDVRVGAAIHWEHCAFTALAIVAAMWHHANAGITLLALALTAAVAVVVFVPERVFPLKARGITKLVFMAASAGWMGHRLALGTSPDILLVEGIALNAAVLSMTLRPRDYPLTAVTGITMVLYGAVAPRHVYFNIMPLVIVLGLVIVYQFRAAAIAGGEVRGQSGGSPDWRRLCLHLLCLSGFAFVFHILIPAHGPRGLGIIPVEFISDTEDFMPPRLGQWFRPRPLRDGDGGLASGSFSPAPVAGESGGALVDGDGGTESMIPGGGSAPPGKELLFRVRSPIKLYWLCRLFDQYDGESWTASREMDGQHESVNILLWRRARWIKQHFIVERWISPVLPMAYKGIGWQALGGGAAGKHSFHGGALNVEYGYPDTPFQYRANSKLVIPSEAPGEDSWDEILPPEHYLRLPMERISGRLVELTERIVAGCESPYERAVAIRDHLRGEFGYELMSRPAPPGREPVDYFVFELKEGHCEYFAAAMTIMARLAGLPARVGTGFSPGDFNLIDGLFEVREYHAHAWSQVYIPSHGWLTFDATPPENVLSRTTPVGIGRFHDPFGDEWRVSPPEATERTLAHLGPPLSKESMDLLIEKNRSLSEMLETLDKIPLTREQVNETINYMWGFVPGATPGGGTWTLRELVEAASQNLKSLTDRFSRVLAAVWWWFATWERMGLLAFAVLVAAVAAKFRRPCAAWWRKNRIRWKCRRWLTSLENPSEQTPEQVVALCYLVARETLVLAGLPRPNGLHLLEYADSLGGTDHEIARQSRQIFLVYNEAAYSGRRPSQSDGDHAMEAMLGVRSAAARLGRRAKTQS